MGETGSETTVHEPGLVWDQENQGWKIVLLDGPQPGPITLWTFMRIMRFDGTLAMQDWLDETFGCPDETFDNQDDLRYEWFYGDFHYPNISMNDAPLCFAKSENALKIRDMYVEALSAPDVPQI
jgi:hypothetical protein